MSDQQMWQVKNKDSFERTAVTMSQSTNIWGDLLSGVLKGLARAFITHKIFFAAKAGNAV